MLTEAFSIPASLLSSVNLGRYGRLNPPEEFSPTYPLRDEREGFISVDQLRNETASTSKQGPSLLEMVPAEELSPKRLRTSRQIPTSYGNPPTSTLTSTTEPSQHDNVNVNVQPPKRKRGTSNPQPQMVEAYTAEGRAFQVSSARQTHLEKNRVAARKCRQRNKQSVNGLKSCVQEPSAKNAILKESVTILTSEVLSLENEILHHAGCGFWAVDGYLARCAGDILDMEVPAPGIIYSRLPQNSNIRSRNKPRFQLSGQWAREASMRFISSTDADDPDGIELLKGFTHNGINDIEASEANVNIHVTKAFLI